MSKQGNTPPKRKDISSVKSANMALSSAPEPALTTISNQPGSLSTSTVCENCEKEARADRRQEYAQLRAEIVEHSKTELQLIAIAVTLIAAVSAFTAQLVKDKGNDAVGSLILSISVGLCTVVARLIEGSSRSIAINAAYLIEFHEISSGFKWETRLLAARLHCAKDKNASKWYEGANRSSLISVLGFASGSLSLLLLLKLNKQLEYSACFDVKHIQNIDWLAIVAWLTWIAALSWHSWVSYSLRDKVGEKGLLVLIPEFQKIWTRLPPEELPQKNPSGGPSSAEAESKQAPGARSL